MVPPPIRRNVAGCLDGDRILANRSARYDDLPAKLAGMGESIDAILGNVLV